jgi:hypothetical protein
MYSFTFYGGEETKLLLLKRFCKHVVDILVLIPSALSAKCLDFKRQQEMNSLTIPWGICMAVFL